MEKIKLQILSAGAPKLGVMRCAEAYCGAADLQYKINFATAPEIAERVSKGKIEADVVVAPSSLMSATVDQGSVVRESLVDLGSVSTGVAVGNKTYAPDISSPDALRDAMEDAGALVFNRASSGKYIEAMIEAMGLAEKLAGRIIQTDSGSQVMEYLAENRSKRVMAFAQVTEIRFRQDLGIRLVGLLPHALARQTRYVSGLAADASNIASAKSLLAFFGSNEGQEILLNAGLCFYSGRPLS